MINTVKALCGKKKKKKKLAPTACCNNECVLWFVHPQMKQMEDMLRSCEVQKELRALRSKLELVEEEKREYSDRCCKAEVEVKDLRFTGEDIFGTVMTGCTVGHYTVRYRGQGRINTVEGALCVL